MKANLEWRARLIGRAEEDKEFRAGLLRACAESPVVAFNLLFWTYLKNDISADGTETQAKQPHMPFVTWPVQDEAIEALCHAIDNRRPIMFWKSREMGVSWLVLGVFVWYLLFKPNSDFLLMSRAEELVDNAGDMDALFPKIRYLLHQDRLPHWILPKGVEDRLRHIKNLATASTIDGRSTTSHTGVGGRRDAAMLDEFARVDNAQAVDSTLTDTAKCKVYVSTPLAGSYFNKLRFGGRIKIVTLPWWRHPGKAQGFEWREHVYHEDGPNKGMEWRHEEKGWKPWSPWYQLQIDSREPWDVAENIDMDPKGSAESFYPPSLIVKHTETNAKKPLLQGEMVYEQTIDPSKVGESVRRGVWESTQFVSGGDRSPWTLWCEIFEDVKWGVMRPRQDTAYVAFADISKGSGASNTTFAFYDVDKREQVAEFCDPFTPPHEAARLFVAAANWFGGVYMPLLGWEQNGDGVIFGNELMKLGYPRVYYQEVMGQRGTPRTKTFGWNNTGKNRLIFYGNLRTALHQGFMTIRSRRALDEMGNYTRFEDGTLGAAEQRDQVSGARDAHGDLVTAHAGAVMLLQKHDFFDAVRVRDVDEHSFEFRRRIRERSRQESEQEAIWL